MKRECVFKLLLPKLLSNINLSTRRSLNRKPSLSRGIMKTVMQVVLVLALLWLLPPMLDGVAAEGGESRSEYQLGSQDKIRVRVHEWRPSRDEIFAWKSLNNDDVYTVNSSGHVALPLLGEIFAGGMSTAELARFIGLQLKERMALLESPDTIVEVVEFRPFYILGAVEKPGAYPYRPGLVVLQAYSLAGGRQRNSAGMMRLERESITTRGQLQTIDLEIQGLMSRMARLEAELANATEVKLPTALIEKQKIDESVDRIVKREQIVFETRKKALETQLTALNQLKSHLEQAVVSMQKQLDLQETQVETVQKELDSVTILFKKGLSSAPRKLALERTLAQVGGDRLRLEAMLMQVRQDVSKTKIAIIDLQAKRTSDISTEMRKTQARFEELKHRMVSSKQLLFETEVIAPQVLAEQKGRQLKPIFKILRQRGAVTKQHMATETTIVEPGDTIKVELPPSEMSVPSVEMSSTAAGPDRIPASANEISDRFR